MVRLSMRMNSGSPGVVPSPPPTRYAKVAGMIRPIVARISEAAFMPTTSWSYCCTPFLMPPTSNDAAEHEQQVADDRSGDRGVDDRDLAVEDQEGGDDDLADVADRRVHDPADPRAGRDAQLLRGVAQEEGERQDRDRGDPERERRLGVEDAQSEGRDRADRGDGEGGDQHRRMVLSAGSATGSASSARARGASKICCGGPCSTITPSSMNTIRSATARAKPISWVTHSIVMPVSGELAA